MHVAIDGRRSDIAEGRQRARMGWRRQNIFGYSEKILAILACKRIFLDSSELFFRRNSKCLFEDSLIHGKPSCNLISESFWIKKPLVLGRNSWNNDNKLRQYSRLIQHDVPLHHRNSCRRHRHRSRTIHPVPQVRTPLHLKANMPQVWKNVWLQLGSRRILHRRAAWKEKVPKLPTLPRMVHLRYKVYPNQESTESSSVRPR